MDKDMFLDNKTKAVDQEEKNIKLQKIRIDFSFKREVFFIVAGALMGAIVMAIPMTFLYAGIGSGYYLTWIVFGHIVGVHSSTISSTIIAGFAIHITTATCIGIAAGLLLYKTNILNISKPSNGLRYGLLVGVIVYLVWAIPVGQFILNPEFGRALSSTSSSNTNTNNFHNANLLNIFYSIYFL
jgi:hypothetical protein